MVTLIGIDITNRNLADRGMPSMDAFWHRVLGKRGRPIERATNNTMLDINRELRYFDSDIAMNISSSGSAGLALLLGFALFAVYWGLGGPLGYALLTHFGLKKHTWLAFIAAIGVFTLVGWGGVSVLRPRSSNMQQVAYLDAIDGGRFQRVRSFASVFIPGYADASVRVGVPDNEYPVFRNFITHWAEHYNSLLGSASFPDARNYAVSARDPDIMRFPARATEKRFRLDWAGPERWPMPNAISATGGPGVIKLDAAGNLTGTIVHNMPGILQDAVVVVVRGQRFIGVQTGQPVISLYEAYKFTGGKGWAPQAELDLAIFTATKNPKPNAQPYFDDLMSRARGSEFSTTFTRGSDNERLIAAAFVSQIRPPLQSDTGTKSAVVRRSTHGLDLGKWITQPCIIVLGVVQISKDTDAMNPLPVYLKRGGGWKEIDWSGKVVVRWVYPLDENPPRWQSTAAGLAEDIAEPKGAG